MNKRIKKKRAMATINEYFDEFFNLREYIYSHELEDLANGVVDSSFFKREEELEVVVFSALRVLYGRRKRKGSRK